MLRGLKKKLSIKHKKQNGSSSSSVTGSISDVEDRVVMLCEDIQSEGSSWDSGRGSQSPGARSIAESHSGDQEPGQEWSRMVSQARQPLRQRPVKEVRYLDSASPPSPGDHYTVRSTLHVKELYGSKLTL